MRDVAAVVALLSPVGCVLLVSPISGGDHCAFEGSGACAACIRASCQANVDACCRDEDCRTARGSSALLPAMDACGKGDAKACASALTSQRSGTVDEALRACVVGTCGEACSAGGDAGPGLQKPKPDWSCEMPQTSAEPCASCIYTSCGTALDTCCEGTSCSRDASLVADLTRCMNGDQPGCAYIFDRDTSGQAGVVRACIKDKCGETCMGEGRTHQKCSLYAGGTYCSCSDAETSSGDECSKATVGGHCILGKKGCSCGEYACTKTFSFLCTCAFGSTSNELSSCSPATFGGRGTCCVKVGDKSTTCSCGENTYTCQDDEYPIATCSEADMLDKTRNILVDRCSL